MFALEITFKDGASAPETLFVRRLEALIGGVETAHVVIDDLASLDYQLRLIRMAGRRFKCQPVAISTEQTLADTGEGIYEGEFEIDTGSVKLRITALDPDLFLKESEPPDRAGVRVLRQSCSTHVPVFPAILVRGERPVAISFTPDQPVYIGRAKHCVVRVDAPRVSSVHARIGFEGRQFWVEDLGSTNGTFVRGQPVASRVSVAPGEEIILAREVTLVGVTSEEQLDRAAVSGSPEALESLSASEHQYPVLLSLSEVARPSRLVLGSGSSYTIGRDPGSDMWLGAPHVSRLHCSVEVTKGGRLTLVDQSTNGTAHDEGVLHRGERLDLANTPKVLNFGAGLTVALCFSKADEEQFQETGGATDTFLQTTSSTGRNLPQLKAGLPKGQPNLLGSGAIERGRTGGGRLAPVLGLYDTLTPSSRVLFMVTAVAIFFAVGVVGSLVAGLFWW